MRDKHSSNKILAVIVALVLAIIGATGLVVATHPPHAKVAVTPAVHAPVAKSPTTHLSYKGKEGKTALDLLRTHAHITTKQSSFGEYVESIDDVKGGVDGKYWTFYVNGSQAQVGAGSYVTKNGDAVEWKLE